MKFLVKSLFVVVFVFIISTLFSCSLMGLSKDDAKKNLEDAGYDVTVIDGNTYTDSDDNTYFLVSTELEYYLYAKKGEEEIYMYFFYTIDQASSYYTFMTNSKLKSGQNNNVVYFGTKQAIKDSKI